MGAWTLGSITVEDSHCGRKWNTSLAVPAETPRARFESRSVLSTALAVNSSAFLSPEIASAVYTDVCCFAENAVLKHHAASRQALSESFQSFAEAREADLASTASSTRAE